MREEGRGCHFIKSKYNDLTGRVTGVTVGHVGQRLEDEGVGDVLMPKLDVS